jgi:hypothetical protein
MTLVKKLGAATALSLTLAGGTAIAQDTTITIATWRAPIGWSGMSVSASLASGPLGRCSLARVVDTPMSYAA